MLWVASVSSTSAIASPSIQVNQSNTSITQQSTGSSQGQTTEINLEASNLKAAHILMVNAPTAAQLDGEIAIDGRVIQQFGTQGVSINVTPYLSRGKHTIEISGRYVPAQSSVQVQFVGSGSQVSQQTGGNGVLKQTLVIHVL